MEPFGKRRAKHYHPIEYAGNPSFQTFHPFGYIGKRHAKHYHPIEYAGSPSFQTFHRLDISANAALKHPTCLNMPTTPLFKHPIRSAEIAIHMSTSCPSSLTTWFEQCHPAATSSVLRHSEYTPPQLFYLPYPRPRWSFSPARLFRRPKFYQRLTD